MKTSKDIKRSLPIDIKERKTVGDKTLPQFTYSSDDDDDIPLTMPILKRQNAMFLDDEVRLNYEREKILNLSPIDEMADMLFLIPPKPTGFEELINDAMLQKETLAPPVTPLSSVDLWRCSKAELRKLKQTLCSTCGKDSFLFCPCCAETEAKATMESMYDDIWSSCK